jgi:hypothetical protein
MGARDKRVDQYIAKSADFAKPILTYLRDTVHETCPDCEETLKWRKYLKVTSSKFKVQS